MFPIENYIRNIPDFPKPGIQFKDLTPLLANAAACRATVARLIEPFTAAGITAVAGMEARGFIFGSMAALTLDCGFIPLRKPGKLPYDTHSEAYDLEYGQAALEVHIDALQAGDKVLLVDDLIATGGTAAASCNLIERLGAEIAGCAFVVELTALHGRALLGANHVHSVIKY